MHLVTDPFNSLKPCTQLQASAHTAADFLNHPKPSAHIAAEVVHAHSWDLTFSYKIALASHQFLLIKSLTSLLYKSAYLYIALLQNHGLRPWAPQTLNPGLKPWVYYKKRSLTQP